MVEVVYRCLFFYDEVIAVAFQERHMSRSDLLVGISLTESETVLTSPRNCCNGAREFFFCSVSLLTSMPYFLSSSRMDIRIHFKFQSLVKSYNFRRGQCSTSCMSRHAYRRFALGVL